MRTKTSVAGATVVAGLLLLAAGVAVAVPKISTPVTDEVGIMTPGQVEAVAARLVRHREATGVQLAVLVVATTAGQPIDDFAQEVFDAWGGGEKGEDRGALFVLAMTDRRSRLHLGYGLEPVISDGVARKMLDALKPSLRAGDPAGATSHLVDAVIARTKHLVRGEAVTVPWSMQLGQGLFWFILLAGVVAGSALGRAFFGKVEPKKRKRRRRWGKRRRRKKRKTESPEPPLSSWVWGLGAVAFLLGPAVIWAFGSDGGYEQVNLVTWALGVAYGLVAARYWRKSPAIPISFLFLHSILLVPAGFNFTIGEFDPQQMWDLVQVFIWTTVPLAIVFGFSMLTGSGGGSSSSSYSSSGSSWSSSSSSSSYSSSSYSSSSYSSSSYSGGGGSSGGGGASSGW